jgi:hypothetical protein
MSHKLALTVPLHWRARCSQLRCSSGVGATIYNADAPPQVTQEAGDDRVSGADADRHDDIFHNGSSEFRGADSAEMAGLRPCTSLTLRSRRVGLYKKCTLRIIEGGTL